MIDFLDNYTHDESTEAHQKDLLLAEKGWFKFSQTYGAGLTTAINDEGFGNILHSVRTEFQRDGMAVEQVILKEGNIHVDAHY